MDIKKRDFLLGGRRRDGGAASADKGRGARRAPGTSGPIQVGDPNLVNAHVQPSSVDRNYKPRRINKAIELWEDGQPIYYGIWGVGPGVDPYAQGVRMAKTYLDAINVEMEHGALDFSPCANSCAGWWMAGRRRPAIAPRRCLSRPASSAWTKPICAPTAG